MSDYLEKKYGFKVTVLPETDPNKVVIERVYNAWRRLFVYWLGSATCKTTYWISEVNVELMYLWHKGDLAGVKQLFSLQTLAKARKAIRRTPGLPPDHKLLPRSVANEIQGILTAHE